jgi:hypothetical protein
MAVYERLEVKQKELFFQKPDVCYERMTYLEQDIS